MTEEPPPALEPDEMPPAFGAEDPWASRPDSSRERLRIAARWVLSGLLVLTLGALMASLSFAQVTEEGPAKGALGSTVGILSEVDALLDTRYEALRQDASGAEAPDELKVPDFPLELSFTPEEITSNSDSLDSDREAFRALLLSRAADQVYEDGPGAFEAGQDADIGFFSTEGALKTGMNLLRERPHEVSAKLTIALAALSAVLALGVALVCRGYGRVAAIGLSVVLASTPFLVLAVAVRFTLRLGADGTDDYMAREFLELGQEMAWAAVRGGIVFAVCGIALLVLGSAFAFWSDRRQRPQLPAA